MTLNDITTLITTVGFPIVMCGALFWKMDKQDKDHKEETAHLTEALANNTAAIEKLASKLNFDNRNEEV